MSLVGLILGLVCVVGGVFLFFFGRLSDAAAGGLLMVVGLLGGFGPLSHAAAGSDAAAGAVLFVVGLLIILIARFAIRLR